MGVRAERGTRAGVDEVYNRKCDPHWSEAELRHKVRSALGAAHNRPRGYLLGSEEMSGCVGSLAKPDLSIVEHIDQAPSWPSIDLDRIERIVSGGYGLYDLWEASPIRLEHPRTQSRAVEIISLLFPGDPLLCCGWTRSDFYTRLRLEWGNEFEQLELIVPNPMLSREGQTQKGQVSANSLEATAARVYQCIEFDFTALDHKRQPTVWSPLIQSCQADDITIADACAALIMHLAGSMPLACVCRVAGVKAFMAGTTFSICRKTTSGALWNAPWRWAPTALRGAFLNFADCQMA